MTRAARSVYNFLDFHFGLYDNPQGIEFVVNCDDTVFVIIAFNPPPEPFIDYGLFYPSADFDTFMRDFRFTGAHAVKKLTVDDLWKLYYAGKAEIFCTIAVNAIWHALYYRLTKNNTMIVRDDHDIEHEVGEVLHYPQQFVEYTQAHYLHYHG